MNVHNNDLSSFRSFRFGGLTALESPLPQTAETASRRKLEKDKIERDGSLGSGTLGLTDHFARTGRLDHSFARETIRSLGSGSGSGSWLGLGLGLGLAQGPEVKLAAPHPAASPWPQRTISGAMQSCVPQTDVSSPAPARLRLRLRGLRVWSIGAGFGAELRCGCGFGCEHMRGLECAAADRHRAASRRVRSHPACPRAAH